MNAGSLNSSSGTREQRRRRLQHMSELELWYSKPAEVWTEALPIGNGRLGGMVFGDISRERLQINESTLFTGGPYSIAQFCDGNIALRGSLG